MPDLEAIDLATVTDSVFRPHLNSEFMVRAGEDAQLALTLVDIAEYPDHRPEEASSSRKPFGLIFRCDAGVLEQGCYAIAHAALPPCELFLSPFEGGDGWCKLEAIFN